MRGKISELSKIKNSHQLDQKGIFLIRCVPTGDTYIGSTTRNFRIHWKELRKQMRNLQNPRVSRRLRHLWQNYGDEGFEFEILEVTNRISSRKKYYLNLYRPSLNH